MRLPRVTLPGRTYHVVARCLDREWLLIDDERRRRYLGWLGHALTASTWRLLAYALMSNHVHLVAVAGEEAAGGWLKATHAPFGRWLNLELGRQGQVLADRPRTWLVREADVPRVIAYVHNNPVRAGVVPTAAASTWTSHRAYLGGGAPTWLDRREGLARCGGDAATFDAWVAACVGDARPRPDAELREAQRRAHRRGSVELASPTEQLPLQALAIARPHANVRPSVERLLEVAAARFAIAPPVLRAARPRRGEVLVRRAVVLAARALGMTTADVCAGLGITRQAGTKLARPPVNAASLAMADEILHAMDLPGRWTRR